MRSAPLQTGPTFTSTDTMRAVVHHSFGSADVLRLERVGVPAPRNREVLVRVRAAGLDRGAWHVMTGKPYLGRVIFGLRRPRHPVLGHDLAGTVVAVGADVQRFAVGDEVFGTATGAFAEYVAAREDRLALRPESLDVTRAAVVPVSGMTALQALRISGVGAGQRVLVNGASGGVGSYAVQIAKATGAHVTGVASTAKLDLVWTLGADAVVDYLREDFADSGPYDAIIDIAGNPSLRRLRRALAPGGIAVITGGEEGGSFSGGLDRQLRGMVISLFGRRKVRSFICKENAEDLGVLAEMIGTGSVAPSIDRVYALEQTPDAMRQVERGEVRGKIAITVAD